MGSRAEMKSPDLMLFAKQPVAGQVKTRLQSDYAPLQVVEIAAFLIRASVQLASSSWPSEIYLYGAPDADHALFQELVRDFHIHLASQAPGDLGQKMLQAMHQGIARSGAAGILGCDVPHCPWEIIEQAHEHLASGRYVLGPAEDGGYYFIGLQQAHAALFEGIVWGNNRVAEVTLSRARHLGINFEMLPVLNDIDTTEDLWFAAQGFEPLRTFLYGLLAQQPSEQP
jgi:rSAM/selenodomain-associated transferase 1